MVRKLNTTEVKELLMLILDDIHEFCVNNNIQYSLIGGSMLGAIRHKGFIPWDDDVDIMMPRKDYERFMNTYKSRHEYYKATDYRNDKNYISAFGKVYDLRTYTESVNIIDNRSIYIDIFPIDGLPDDIDRDKFLSEVTTLLGTLRKSGKYYLYTKSWRKKLIFGFKYLIKRLYTPSTETLQHRLSLLLSKCNFEDSKFVGNLVGRWGKKECMRKEIYTDLKLYPFEDRYYMGISNADEYLTNMYGDWRTPPPMEQQVGDHLYEIYIEE